MGSLSRKRAAERVRTALIQQLRTAENRDDVEHILWELMDHYERHAMDDEELNRSARELAVTPEDIDFPD